LLAVRGGQEEKIIEKIKLELEKTQLKEDIRELKIFTDRNNKKIIKGYIFCHCFLTYELVKLFYKVPKVIGFINHERKSDKLPDFISSEMVKNFSIKVEEYKKDNTIKENPGLNIGDLVKITDGTFINYEGRICYLNEKKQEIKVDIEFAGRTTSISVPVKSCQKILI
jgi:transcriptional antiterminator NusG